MRRAFSDLIKKKIKDDNKILTFLGDISVASFLDENDDLINNVYNCGILEQAMVSFAAGCSINGYYPIVQTIVPFIVERAFEQIKLDFCAQNLKGLLVGVGGGLEYNKLGYTHHALWDTSVLSNFDNLTLFTPTLGNKEVTFVLEQFIEKRILAYARLTKIYLEDTDSLQYKLFRLNIIKLGSNTTKEKNCMVVCGSFPSAHKAVRDFDGDVYSYSFPNVLPENYAILKSYDNIFVQEYNTSSILFDIIKKQFPFANISGLHQASKFFRKYGDKEMIEFVENNWVQS